MVALKFTCFLLLISKIYCGVLILSPKETQISGLKPFDIVEYNNLKSNFKKGKIISFKINSDQIPQNCKSILQNKYTSYVPTIDYEPENIILLNNNEKDNCNEIKKKIRSLELDNQKNIIYLIFHNSLRVKRQNIDNNLTTTQNTFTTEENVIFGKERNYPKLNFDPDESIVYEVPEKALLYSAKAPILIINDTAQILGQAALTTFDERGNYSRLSCTIPVEDGKITLRFRFPWENGYWSLSMVEIEIIDANIKYNLSITKDVTAPEGFSHICGGETVFSDQMGIVNLTLFDLQVQPRTNQSKFSDAFNCVPFVTGPICSGIFVTSILAIGLLIGLSALGSIKTMDKFDNSKTKQLTITIMGE